MESITRRHGEEILFIDDLLEVILSCGVLFLSFLIFCSNEACGNILSIEGFLFIEGL